MDVQKTIIRVLELFRMLAILYGITLVIFVASAFHIVNKIDEQQAQQNFACGVVNTNNYEVTSELAVAGETLFKDNCSQCHAATTEQIVGPGLQGIEQRRKIDWIREWIRNPKKVLDSGDKYANEIFVKFNKTQMTAFPNFTDKDIDAILQYVKEVNGEVAVP